MSKQKPVRAVLFRVPRSEVNRVRPGDVLRVIRRTVTSDDTKYHIELELERV